MAPDMNWIVPGESVRIGNTIYISSDKLSEWGNSLNYLGSRSLIELELKRLIECKRQYK